MPTMGNGRLVGEAGVRWRMAGAAFCGRRSGFDLGLDFVLSIVLATPAQAGVLELHRVSAWRPVVELAFHAFADSQAIVPAIRRMDRADSTTSRCVPAISFLSPWALTRAPCFKPKRRTWMPNNVWAILFWSSRLICFARQPKLSAPCKLACGPRRKCSSNAAAYRRDKLVSFRFMCYPDSGKSAKMCVRSTRRATNPTQLSDAGLNLYMG